MRWAWFVVLCSTLGICVPCFTGCDTPLGSRLQEIPDEIGMGRWTEDMIRKYPEQYLKHVMGQCDETANKIEENRITYRREKSKLESQLASATGNLERYQQQLEAYKEAYRTAEESGQWPTVVNGGPKLSQRELRTVIVDKNQQVDKTKEEIDRNPELIRRLDNRLADLDVKEHQVRQAKAKAEKKLEDLRLGQVFESVEDIQIKLDELAAAPDSLGDVKPEVALEDVETPVDPVQSEFDAIMNN